MIRLGQIRRSPRLIRSVLAVFLLAWLQMAAVPCVMGGTTPPASDAAMETHEGMEHAGMVHESPDMPMSTEAEGHHDCIYCPPSSSDQPISPTNCVYPDQPQADRSSHTQVVHWVLSAAPDLHSFDPVIQRHPVQTLMHAAPPQPRPLNLTHCVQLK